MDRVNAVADESVAQGLDDGYATSHCGLEEDRHLALARQGKDLGASLCEEGLVTSDDNASRPDRGDRQVEGLGGPSDELHNHLDLGILQEILPAAGEKGGWGCDITLFLRVAHDDPAHVKGVSGTLCDQIAVTFQILIDPCTDGAKAR